MIDLRPPLWTNFGWLAAVFVGVVIVFHLLLVWPRNLTKRRWKIVDYFWLGAGLIGVIGSAGVARQTIAESLLTSARALVESLASDLESTVRSGISPAVCRRFVRTEFSPPPVEFDRIQREFDALCSWFTQAVDKLKTSPLAKRQPLSLGDLGADPPKVRDDWPMTHVRDTLDRYNRAVGQVDRLTQDARRSDLELTTMIIGPFMLVVALALRVAKVTGEIRHEIA